MDTYRVCEINSNKKPTCVRASRTSMSAAYQVMSDILQRSPNLPIRVFTDKDFRFARAMPDTRQVMSRQDMGSYVKKLTRMLSDAYNCNITIKIHKGKRTCCYKCGDKNTTITYGLATLSREFNRGMNEYDKVKWVWSRCGRIAEKKALWAIVLHEFSHVLQKDRARGIMHTRGFIQALQELIRRFPYESVKNL